MKNKSIKVIGIGGAGTNAVTHYASLAHNNVDVSIINTDANSLKESTVSDKIQIGEQLTKGRGSASNVDVGRDAALESIDEIRKSIKNVDLLILVAGLGGGTGTAVTSFIAKLASEMGILTVSIVTLPHSFEGRKRTNTALEGLDELKKTSSSICLIDNNTIKEVFGNLKISDAFAKSDEMQTQVIQALTSILLSTESYVKVDFEDLKTVLGTGGIVQIVSTTSTGNKRATDAINNALMSPFISTEKLKGADYILLNVTTGKKKVTMDEMDIITNIIHEQTNGNLDIIWGNDSDENLDEEMRITLFATGFDTITSETEFIPILKDSEEETLSLYFLEDEYTTDEIAELISFLSDLYREIGGNKLIIKGMDIYEYEPIFQTVEV